MQFEIGDAVKTELRADGPRIEGTVTAISDNGQFVTLAYTRRDGKPGTAAFEAAGCELVQGAGAQGEAR